MISYLESVSFLKLYRNNLTPSEKKTFKVNNEDEIDINLNIDPEIISQWNELGITADFKQKFIQKLTYFNETFHHHFFEIEKKTLKQVSFYLSVSNIYIHINIIKIENQ